MSHDVIYFPSEKCFSDGGLVCPMDPSEPSKSIFVHRSQIASIGHICFDPFKLAMSKGPRTSEYRLVRELPSFYFQLSLELAD